MQGRHSSTVGSNKILKQELKLK